MVANKQGFEREIKMKQYVVDVFLDKVFGGNPTAICIMDN